MPAKKIKNVRKTASKTASKSVKKPLKAKVKAKAAPKRKTANVKPIPKGYATVTPYLIIENAAEAIKFYKKAFGATEIMRFAQPKTKKILHAEIKIGNSLIMLADEFPEMGCHSPKCFGGSPISMHLYVEKVDAVFKKAIAAGAKVQRPVKDQFYGDRSGSFVDPFGHIWNVSTHVENVSPKEIMRRFAEGECS